MDYNTLLELAADLGYRLAMNGAETFRIEESIYLLLKAYGIDSETFAIPNCLTVSIETPEGKPMTRMRRIGQHGNDLDSVGRYSNLCRRICSEKPEPQTAKQWLKETDASLVSYPMALYLLGHFLGAFGFAVFFGGAIVDSICAGFCGIVVGLLSKFMSKLSTNQFFSTIISSFVMAVIAYIMGTVSSAVNADTVVIGTLMILVPGLLFTNAMRDIIYGDTNSGVNRIVQVFLIAAAIALGTAAAWNAVKALFGEPASIPPLEYGFLMQELGCFIGCMGFAIVFNVHGTGRLFCALGGLLSWGIYLLTVHLGGTDIAGYFWAAVIAAQYSEVMARLLKYPAISYLVISIFPLIPGASIYYTMHYAVVGDMASFAAKGMHTIAIAAFIAVAILLISTSARLFRTWRLRNK